MMNILNLIIFLLVLIVFVLFVYNTITQFIFIYGQCSDEKIRQKSLFTFVSMFLILNIDFKTKLWLLIHIPLRVIEPKCLSKPENVNYRRTTRITRAIFFLSTLLLVVGLIVYFKCLDP